MKEDHKDFSVSIVIPTFYNIDTLPKTIKSIKNQKIKPKEVIVIDNNKKKLSKNLIKNLRKKYKINLKYLSFNGNPDNSRNYAVRKSISQLIAFIDDDDTWEPNYLSNNLKLFKKYDLDFIYTDMNIINLEDKIINKVKLPKKIKLESLFVFNQGFFCSNLIIKKDIFQKKGGFNSNSGSADKELAICLAEQKYKYYINPRRLVNKRASNNQWSQNFYSMLKNNYKFYNKYKNRVNYTLKFSMLKKMLKLFFKIFL